MRRAVIASLLCGCAPAVAQGTALAVPAVDVADNQLEGPTLRLAVPAEDLAKHPGPRPTSTLILPDE